MSKSKKVRIPFDTTKVDATYMKDNGIYTPSFFAIVGANVYEVRKDNDARVTSVGIRDLRTDENYKQVA